MWAILKVDRKNLTLLKRDLKIKVGADYKIYIPTLLVQKYKTNKLISREFSLMGDYVFCFHKNFENLNIINGLKFLKGLKYFLDGHIISQSEIINFIKKCKDSENKDGYLSENFFEITINSTYKFTSGPFTEKIFKIVELQKNKIKILIGNVKMKIKYNNYSFNPV
tara:strand:+ start:448 stop:945 length:498 start_codon:yes stop_codon:yes gene_type:complete